MSLLRECEFLYSEIKQGRPVVDRHVGLRETKRVKGGRREVRPCDIDRNKKHERCPSCGGMVILPCLACSLERWEDAKR